MKTKLLIPLFVVLVCSCNAQNPVFLNYSIPLQSLIDSFKIGKDKIEIHIDKSDYKLSISANSIIIKEYPVVFGANPVGDKLRQGDNCTPEGVFRIKSKYPHAKWSKFIWIDYPSSESWQKHEQAKREGKIPANAQIGGEVGIHGVPYNADYAIEHKMNWTKGCISLKNKDVDEIYNFVSNQTLVTIQQ